MKLIIAGGRNVRCDHEFIHDHLLEAGIKPSEIVSGGASGIDRAGEIYADKLGLILTRFLPEWDLYGKSAGPIRNRQMAEYGDALLLIWDGKSRGSLSMKEEMERLNKPLLEVLI